MRMNAPPIPWVVTPHGGVMTPSTLRAIAEFDLSRGEGYLRLNSRQQILLNRLDGGDGDTQILGAAAIRSERLVRGLAPNIVTTLPVLGMTTRTPWLTRRVFDAALDGLRHRGPLTVGICDAHQEFLPVCGNAIDFLAGEMADTWHVAIVPREASEPTLLDGVTYTAQMPEIVGRVAASWGTEDADAVVASLSTRLRMQTASHRYPSLHRRRYERLAGFHTAAGTGVGFFGVPAPESGLPSALLHDLCVCAQREGIASVGVTSWGMLLLHPVTSTAAAAVYGLMAAHRVSCHALWTDHWLASPSVQRDGIAANLRALLHDACPTSGGLSLGVIRQGEPLPDTDLVVLADPVSRNRWPWSARRFDVYSRNTGARHACMATRVRECELSRAVLEAMDRLLTATEISAGHRETAIAELPRDDEWPCPSCGTNYATCWGDPLGGIAPGVGFHALPETWSCPVCGEAKAAFTAPPA
jgi:rubredoxin